jgi:hypothetical protein
MPTYYHIDSTDVIENDYNRKCHEKCVLFAPQWFLIFEQRLCETRANPRILCPGAFSVASKIASSRVGVRTSRGLPRFI